MYDYKENELWTSPIEEKPETPSELLAILLQTTFPGGREFDNYMSCYGLLPGTVAITDKSVNLIGLGTDKVVDINLPEYFFSGTNFDAKGFLNTVLYIYLTSVYNN